MPTPRTKADASPLEMRALSFEQAKKLHALLTSPINMEPSNNFPALAVCPATLIKVVRQNLLIRGVSLKDVRLNGSAASYCLSEENEELPSIHYNDVDLIFGVSIQTEYDFHLIKEVVLTSLLEFFPKGTVTDRISCCALKETYVRKMVKVSDKRSRWSLISLGDGSNTTIELKFVDLMNRSFEFTVDSFQIVLDSILNFCERESVSMLPEFFPTVQAQSVYGDYSEALYHLNNRLIHTKDPQAIRGGGLLKYCYLLVKGFKPADRETMTHLELYMCSRFFIDFSSLKQQMEKIHKYIYSRFIHNCNWQQCLQFLDILQSVVNKRARCLMDPQRHETMQAIMYMKNYILWLQIPVAYFPQCVNLSLTGVPAGPVPTTTANTSNVVAATSSVHRPNAAATSSTTGFISVNKTVSRPVVRYHSPSLAAVPVPTPVR